MDDNTRSQINSTDVVDEILIVHEAEWILKAIFAALVVTFRSIRTRIAELLVITEIDHTGIAADKAVIRDDLITKGYRICRAIYLYAKNTSDLSKAQIVDDSLSDLKVKDDEKLIAYMKTIHALAVEDAVELVDYEVEAAETAALLVAITALEDWKADPTSSTVQQKSANAELLLKVREIMAHQKTLMDPAMYLFETSGTSFYADYFNARNIIQPGGADAQTQNGINPIETDTIINLPFTNLAAGKEVRVKCLTPGTNFEIYCSNAPSIPPTGTPLSINDVISPIYTTTDDLGWLPDSPYVNIHFPPMPVEIEWEVRVG